MSRMPLWDEPGMLAASDFTSISHVLTKNICPQTGVCLFVQRIKQYGKNGNPQVFELSGGKRTVTSEELSPLMLLLVTLGYISTDNQMACINIIAKHRNSILLHKLITAIVLDIWGPF